MRGRATAEQHDHLERQQLFGHESKAFQRLGHLETTMLAKKENNNDNDNNLLWFRRCS